MNVVSWPARLPDLSNIEHLWDHHDGQIGARPGRSYSRNQLAQTLREQRRRTPFLGIKGSRRRVRARALLPVVGIHDTE